MFMKICLISMLKALCLRAEDNHISQITSTCYNYVTSLRKPWVCTSHVWVCAMQLNHYMPFSSGYCMVKIFVREIWLIWWFMANILQNVICQICFHLIDLMQVSLCVFNKTTFKSILDCMLMLLTE